MNSIDLPTLDRVAEDNARAQEAIEKLSREGDVAATNEAMTITIHVLEEISRLTKHGIDVKRNIYAIAALARDSFSCGVCGAIRKCEFATACFTTTLPAWLYLAPLPFEEFSKCEISLALSDQDAQS